MDQSSWIYVIIPFRVYLEEFTYYSYDRSEGETTQVHQLCLSEFNSFIKPQIKMKGCLIMVYLQEILYETEYIIKY